MELAENMIDFNFFDASDVADIFGPNFLDVDVCRQWIFKRLHPAGGFCPCCGSRLSGGQAVSFWQDRSVCCRECGKTFTARTGTILAGKNLTYQEIILMAWLMSRGDTNSTIAGIIGCNRETVRLWRQLF